MIDVLGMAAGDPTPIYHRTSSANAAGIRSRRFDPSRSNWNGFTYFTTSPDVRGIGKGAASWNTLVTATIDLSQARTISKGQMSGWFNEGLVEANTQLNTNYGTMKEMPRSLQSKYQTIPDGVKNAKLTQFMKADGGSVYNITGKSTIAVSEGAIGKVRVNGLSGSGVSDAII